MIKNKHKAHCVAMDEYGITTFQKPTQRAWFGPTETNLRIRIHKNRNTDAVPIRGQKQNGPRIMNYVKMASRNQPTTWCSNHVEMDRA